MSEYVIETEGLTVYYGRHLGIRDVDLKVKKGEVFGFLGPNGAGKTTTQRVLLDVIRPTAGTATVTVKQGDAAGTTTVKINEPPDRERTDAEATDGGPTHISRSMGAASSRRSTMRAPASA